jgi:hypothetical protein
MATTIMIARTTPSTKTVMKRWRKACQVAAEYLRGREDGNTHQVYDFRTDEVLATAPAGDKWAEMDAWQAAKVELAERSGVERPWIRTPWGEVVRTQ